MSAVRCQEYGILGKANLLLPLVLTSETKVSIMLKTCIRRKSKLLSQTFVVFLQQKIVLIAVGCLEKEYTDGTCTTFTERQLYKLLSGNINDIQDTFALQNIKTSMKLLCTHLGRGL